MLNVGNIGKLRNKNQIPVEWPNGNNFGVCLTHDVDRVKKTYQYITHSIRNRNFSSLFSYSNEMKEPYWQFEKIMDIEKKYNVRSTFFFLNESIKFEPFSFSNWPFSLGRYDIKSEKIKKIIRKLDSEGWEIGIHGSIKSYNNYKLLLEEKQILEEILGHEIIGMRQHWLNLHIPKTWQLHRKLGLKYDCTFGLKKGIGFKENIVNPFLPFNDNFMVFPLAIMDSYLFDLYPKYDDALNQALRIIDVAQDQGGLLTILWHQSVFGEKEFPHYSRLYKKIIEECIKRKAWFGTCGQAYNYIIGSKDIVMEE